jgi:hypothetical protein
MRLPHPVRFERLQGNKKHYERQGIPWIPFESFCQKFFETLPGTKTFLDYRTSYLGTMPRTGISATDVSYAIWRKPRIYMIEEGIGELLLNTKLGDIVTAEHFRLPFETMYIDLPDNDFEVRYRLHDGGVQVGPLDGIYVLEDGEITFTTKDIENLVGSNENLAGRPLRPVTFILVSGQAQGPKTFGQEQRGELPMDDCLFSFPMFFHEGSLKPQIDTRVDEFLSRKKVETDVDADVLEKNLEHFKGIFEWLVNISLYITMPKSRIDRGKGNLGIPLKKLEKNKKARRGMPGNKVFVVGRGIKISHLMKKELGTQRSGKKGAKRQAHWVSGHWKNVRYGPMKIDGVKIPKEQRSSRNRWILPFPRGEGSEYFRNIFNVTE